MNVVDTYTHSRARPLPSWVTLVHNPFSLRSHDLLLANGIWKRWWDSHVTGCCKRLHLSQLDGEILLLAWKEQAAKRWTACNREDRMSRAASFVLWLRGAEFNQQLCQRARVLRTPEKSSIQKVAHPTSWLQPERPQVEDSAKPCLCFSSMDTVW